jgi:hypothetical protein
MKRILVLVAASSSIVFMACGSSSSSGQTYVDLVSSRYADCIASLGGASSTTFDESKTGNREGFVIVSTARGDLTFAVGAGNGNATLTFPNDDTTISLLESVGC